MPLQVMIIPVTPFQQNCVLLWDSETKDAAIVDPGGDVPRILDAINETGAKVSGIYLPHGHVDHAGGATELAKILKLPITGPGEEDKFLLKGMEKYAQQFGFTAQNCEPDRWTKEGDKVTLGGAEFEILHCPGHTPGHVVFVNHEAKFGIFGDVLFRNSVGRTDFPYGSHETLINAIKTKLLMLPNEFAFVCGHGESSTIGKEKRSNPFIQ
jgi:glyoxylase-like metal-dependent hydrolase (beta-lactamase superfamily II)